MTKSLILLVAALLALSLVGCAQATPPASTTSPAATDVDATTTEPATPPEATASATEPASTPDTAPSAPTKPAVAAIPKAAKVWDSMLSSGSYRSWEPAPGFASKQPGTGPHGAFVQVFVDPTMSRALKAKGTRTWPVGGMIVKDAFTGSKKLRNVEFMQKTKKGWYYASYTPDGSVAIEGVLVEGCNGCHSRSPNSNGVKSFRFSR